MLPGNHIDSPSELEKIMRQTMLKLWNDDGGALLALEWVFMATILVIGLVAGLAAVRNAVVSELTEIANAAVHVNQCVAFSGLSNCAGHTCGSNTEDQSRSFFNTIEQTVTQQDINDSVCQ